MDNGKAYKGHEEINNCKSARIENPERDELKVIAS